MTDTNTLIKFILPHFDKYPLVGSKQLDYLDWKKAILLSSDKLANASAILHLKNEY